MGGYGQDRAYQGTRSNSWAQRLAPHYHILIFTHQELPPDYDTSPLLELWQNSCRLAKLPIPNAKYGLNWKKGDYSGYVSKWGIENEITKGHVKAAKRQ